MSAKKRPGGVSIWWIAKDTPEDVYCSLYGRSVAAGAFGRYRRRGSNKWQDQNEYASC